MGPGDLARVRATWHRVRALSAELFSEITPSQIGDMRIFNHVQQLYESVASWIDMEA